MLLEVKLSMLLTVIYMYMLLAHGKSKHQGERCRHLFVDVWKLYPTLLNPDTTVPYRTEREFYEPFHPYTLVYKPRVVNYFLFILA